MAILGKYKHNYDTASKMEKSLGLNPIQLILLSHTTALKAYHLRYKESPPNLLFA